MKRTRDALGDELWDALGEAPPPELPEGFDERLAAKLEVRAALGDDGLWDALGAAPEPPPPGPGDVAAVRAAARGRRWAPWIAGALAVAAVLAVWVSQRPLGPEDDLALVRDLELAENLDLVMDPDFELLLRWDGTAP